MAIEAEVGDLGVQLAVSGGLAVVLCMMHALGLVGISKLLRLEDPALCKRSFDAGAVLLVGSMGLCIFLLHVAEIVLFAVVYDLLGILQDFGWALIHSAASYATLSFSPGQVHSDWQLVVAFEGLLGFVLIGWSTAFMVGVMRRLTS